MQKKLALILFGLSYKIYNRHGSRYVDYRKSLDNYKKYIFEEYQNMGYQIDLFFATNEMNDNNIKNQLIADYNPKKYMFIDINNVSTTYSKNYKLLKSMELCLEYSNETKTTYETCIITRFDLIFTKKFSLCNIKYDTINIISILESPRVICDNFYLMPFSMLQQFCQVVEETINISGHNIEQNIKKKLNIERINFIYSERELVEKLSFYKIMRNI